jgi:hypothetical protein
MPMILIMCPVARLPLPTNMSMEKETFELAEITKKSTSCPHCGGIHVWEKQDSWLEGEPVPNGDPKAKSARL